MVVGEHLHEHAEAWDKGDRFERQESLWGLLPRMRCSKPFPDPLGPILRIDHAGNPLTPLATCPRLHKAQGVLKHAADAPKIADPGEKAILDVIDPAGERREVPSKHFSHQLRIAGVLKLGKARVSREGLKVHYLSSKVDDMVAQPPLRGGSHRSPPQTRRLRA